MDRPRHPSGRPIRRSDQRGLSIIRNPGKGPEIPRLRDPEPRDAIGFHINVPALDEGDE